MLLQETVQKPSVFKCGRYTLPIGKKTLIMGILNVTPDSFYDGGKYNSLDNAIKKAHELVNDGVDVIEVGGQSFRPGHVTIEEKEEIGRVLPVVQRLVNEVNVPISVDTCKASVVEKVLDAGVDIINDVWGLQLDERIAQLVSQSDAGIIMMHNSKTSEYKNLIGDVTKFLEKSIAIALEAGISKEKMMIDPGLSFSFGKTQEQHIELLKHYQVFNSLGVSLLHATSRKTFMGNLLGVDVDKRLSPSIATVALGISQGIDMIRVHDVYEMSLAVKMIDEIVRS
ncbi:Dihydropteroate synthase [compost metagenome]